MKKEESENKEEESKSQEESKKEETKDESKDKDESTEKKTEKEDKEKESKDETKDKEKEDKEKKSPMEMIKDYWKTLEEQDPAGWKTFLIALGSLVVGLSLPYYLLSRTNTEEIDIRQLKQQLLATRMVSKILVNGNDEMAYIFVNSEPNPSYHVKLGSDFATFERQLESAEIELGLDETLVEYDWHSFDTLVYYLCLKRINEHQKNINIIFFF